MLLLRYASGVAQIVPFVVRSRQVCIYLGCGSTACYLLYLGSELILVYIHKRTLSVEYLSRTI